MALNYTFGKNLKLLAVNNGGQNELKFSIRFNNAVITDSNKYISHLTISLCISESNLDNRTVTDMGVPLIKGELPTMC